MKYVGFFLLGLLCIFSAYLAMLIVSTFFVDVSREYHSNSAYYRFLLHSSTAIGLAILRVKVHINGKEKIPRGCRFMLVSNHRSNYDPIVTWHALRKYDLSFLSKADNFNIPVWGRLIRRCGFLAIDRSSPRSSVITINTAAEMMRENVVSFGVYPEGTRSKSCELLPFHEGVFMLARKANAPVVVLTVRGTEQIHKRYIRRRTHVYLDVLEVIPASEVEGLRTGEISERVRNEIYSSLEGQINV